MIGLAKSAQADVEVSAATSALPASFQLLSAAELFPALAGQPSCTECKAAADCGSGQYCRDGLCQVPGQRSLRPDVHAVPGQPARLRRNPVRRVYSRRHPRLRWQGELVYK